MKDLAGKQRSTKQRLPSFISHSNRIELCVGKRRNYAASSKKERSLAAVDKRIRSIAVSAKTFAVNARYAATNDKKRKIRRITDKDSISLTVLVEFLNGFISNIETKTEMDQQLAVVKQCSVEQHLPRFISHPNGTVLCVLKK